MTFENALAQVPPEFRGDVAEMDALLKLLRSLKFKRVIDKSGTKIGYASPEYGVSYALRLSMDDFSQNFGWYFLYDKIGKRWYRKPDLLEATLLEIAKAEPHVAERIFDSLNECTACKGKPCSSVSYEYGGRTRAACYGRVIMPLHHDDFICAQAFFTHLNALVSLEK